jgi:hypothetical protein
MSFLSALTQSAKQENYTPVQSPIARPVGRKATPGLISSWTTRMNLAIHEPTTTGQKPHRLTLCGGQV